MQEVRYVHFHDSVFHAGKNFQNKIEPAKHAGLKISFDEEKKRFVIEYKNRTGYLPETSAFIWEPLDIKTPVKAVANEHKTEDKSKRSKAQVATPQSHVFEGRGAGLK